MIWINVKKLEAQLVKGEITDRLAFAYLLCHLVALSVRGHFVREEDLLWAVWAHLLLGLGAMLWGLNRSFVINQQGDNRDYFKRFLSISFVAGLRSVLIVGFVFVCMDFLIAWWDSSFFQEELNRTLKFLAYYVCFLGYFYYMLLRSFRRVNSGEGA